MRQHQQNSSSKLALSWRRMAAWRHGISGIK